MARQPIRFSRIRLSGHHWGPKRRRAIGASSALCGIKGALVLEKVVAVEYIDQLLQNVDGNIDAVVHHQFGAHPGQIIGPVHQRQGRSKLTRQYDVIFAKTQRIA